VTIEQAWVFYKSLTAPTPPAVKRAKRAWSDVRATAGLINDVLPAPEAKPAERES
jgi:hypothetical protein